ncbi:iron-containing redox enzyme family protein [Litoribrevibacter albus]|uniref:Iron-containing redox enzyme family protein n=1 Tax=Litoribrevibacter albus TaxID=1473156 RepID=A0AA37S9U6_9GAMM|nr:iron-containing redox enzyme family protein [Litoribrevibacter albus]GLQ30996.1 hypothetical protein GCM10007876_14750 [Litoribrevibacter albus]
MINQQQLYHYNRDQVIHAKPHEQSFLDFEQQWIDAALSSLSSTPVIDSYEHLVSEIKQMITMESADEPDSARFVSERISLEQFRILVQEFALDGLTEAQIFYAIMPRLSLAAQLPMLRILIDEFGSANPAKTHTKLYRKLLEELTMPTEVDYYFDKIESSSYAFVNMFYWLTLRADDPSYFVGALTYLESIIPAVFPCYTEACQRLGIEQHHYYSEHCHIDDFHAKECFRILKAMHQTDTLNVKKAWQGVNLASLVTNQAFEQAVLKAQRVSQLHARASVTETQP